MSIAIRDSRISDFDRAMHAYEDAVLGAVLLEPGITTELSAVIKPTDFSRPIERAVYSLVRELFERSPAAGIVDVDIEMKARGLDDPEHDRHWLASLADRANVYQAKTDHCFHLARMAKLRVLQRATARSLDPQGVPEDILADASQQIGRVPPGGRREYWEERGCKAPIGFSEFMEKEYRVEYLVDRCLVKNAACVIAGASKSLKTTVSIHLALALATGRPFLGKKTKKTSVMIASAESGEGTLQRNMRGVAAMMEIEPHEFEALQESLSVQFWVPRISDLEQMEFFSECIEQTTAEAVIVDPLYLAMDGDTQGSLGLNGAQIQKLAMAILEKGATPIINDHVKRSSSNAKEFQPIQLEDISGAGKAEFFRQWMLLSRRSKFESDGSDTSHHELWLTMGGSAGHSATLGLDVTETFSAELSGVEYTMSLKQASDVKKGIKTAEIDKHAEKLARREELALKSLQTKCEKVAGEMERKPDQLFTLSDIKSIAHVNADKARELIYELEATGRIVKHPTKTKRGNNWCEAWQAPGAPLLDLQAPENDVGQTWKP